MLWDEGRLCGRFDDETNWRRLASLLEAAADGVRAGSGDSEPPRIMIHFDDGGDNGKCRHFFDRLTAAGVEFDLIGLSFYPWWHGTLGELAANLDDLSERYGRDIIVVETAYPWTLGWFDDEHNIVGLESQLLPGFPATVEGQRSFIDRVIETVEGIEGQRGAGVFYWAPEWIPSAGAGTPWENMTLFDFSGNALYSIGAFE
jgi:arabinogalactan endo-1,4-beta-galactosidase